MRPHRRQPSRLPRPWDSPGKNTGVGCHFLLQCMKVKSESEVVRSCSTISDPVDCSLPGSSVHGIFQARVLEWGAIAFSLNWPSSLLFFEVEDIFFFFTFSPLLLFYFYLEDNCFTVLYWFLLYNNLNQPYVYIHSSLLSFPPDPSQPPTHWILSSRLSQSTRLGPSSLPLALCFYMIMYIFQCCSLNSHHPLLPSVSTSSFSMSWGRRNFEINLF